MTSPARPFGIFFALLFGLAALVVAGPTPDASAATKSCSASAPVAQRPTLLKGDRGTCVLVLQNLLVSRGCTAPRRTARSTMSPMSRCGGSSMTRSTL